ncbi:MAG: ComF family protein, partial [Candidatus Harrisonbacteria bacterium]|nr:ComF family protein [Candidatus Harrisonbacteria bacterium]
ITDALVRTIHAQPQSELSDWRARHMNVAGAFAVPVPHQVARKDILLFDDVTTSGATFFEASVALKCAGARRIIAVAAAKA